MSAVLVLGLDPECVSPERMGGFSPAVVRAYLDAQFDRIRALGHEVESEDLLQHLACRFRGGCPARVVT